MSRGRNNEKYRGGEETGVYPEGASRNAAYRASGPYEVDPRGVDPQGADLRQAALKWKRFAILAFLFFLFLYVIITGLISMSYAGEIIHPPQSPVPPVGRNLANPYTSVSFRSGDGSILLQGWHFNAKKTENALIIVHGFGGNRFPFDEETLELVEAVIAENYNVLVFDLRNSGSSASGISTFGLHEKHDVTGAVDYMRGIGYENIVLLGISTGANAAALAGAESPVEHVSAMILDSPVVDMRNYIMHLVREKNPELPEFPFSYIVPSLTGVYINGDISDADAGGSLDKFMPRSVLLIYGNNDEIVSFSEITDLYDSYMSRAVGNINIWNIQGAGHGGGFYHVKDEYIERVTAFLRRMAP